ncbi:hypothetical protein LFM09_35630 [Lentzea alba]|uniref:hypothetical protein n=1 Tax=Lentzea alba TaxID=2714351 RepID=UPI0039BFEFFF
MRFTVLGCAALIIAGLTTGTASATDETTCSTPVLTSAPVQLDSPGRWSYTYRVSWCVEGGKITAITPHVTHEENGDACVWVANAEESQTPVLDGSGAWNAFNMAEFSCKNGDGTDGIANPWGTITVWPNGTSSVLRKGIGDVIVE